VDVSNDKHWLEEPQHLRSRVQKVKNANRASINEAATYLALYFNRPAVTLSQSDGASIIGFDGLKELGFNVMAEAIQGSKSQIVQPLQPRVSPIGGTWQTLRSCEGLGQVIDGVFDLVNFTKLAGALVVQGALCGEGYGLIEVDPIKSDFTATRLDPLETFFNSDRTEVVTTRMFSRRRLRAYYGKTDQGLVALINALPRYTPDHLVEVDVDGQWDAEDNVALYCGWAASIGGDVGKHVLQLGDQEGTVLLTRPWPHPLPVFSFQWDEGHRGENDARPGGRALAPYHYWLNEMVRKLNDALKGAVPVVIGDTDPNWSNMPYQFIPKETGATVEIPKTVSADVTAQIDRLHEGALREFGISEDAAAGSAPPQFKSGVALSTWRQIVNSRLSQQHRAYEGLWTQASRIICAMAPEVYKSKQARTAARGTEIIREIDFDKVKLPEDSYSVSFDAVTDLPKHIPQKLELLAFLEEKGGIDTAQLMLHLDVVDFRAVAKRMNGPRALIELQISMALSEGELIPPSELQDHGKLAELAGQAYQAAMAQHMKPPRANMQALLHLYLLAKARTGAAPTAPSGAVAPAPALPPEVAPPLDPGTVAPPAEPLPIV
jgi:hypothetical protein